MQYRDDPEINIGSSVLFPSTFVEPEEEPCVWDKSTLTWYNDNLDKVKLQVKYMARDLCQDDQDTIVSDLQVYLQRGRDYGELAEGEENHLTLEQYVYKGASYCVKRFRHARSEENKRFERPVKAEDDTEKNPLDVLGDDKVISQFDSVECDLEKSLKEMQYKRNYYGVDLYQIIYLAFLKNFSHDEEYCTILDIFGASKKELDNACRKAQADSEFCELLKDLHVAMKSSNEYTHIMNMIGKFVFGRKMIEQAMNIIISAA